MGATESEAPNEDTAWAWLQNKHPALTAWLAPFADAARQRTDQGDYWWELRACAYYDKFEQPKIIYPVISQGGKFSLDDQSLYCNDKGFFVTSAEQWHVALLNSKVVWFVIQGVCSPLRGGVWRYELRAQNIETLPVPAATSEQQTELSALATAAAQAAQERLTVQRNLARRITDLLPSPPPKGAQTTLGEKLSQWWLLADFKTFQAEVQKRFKADIPLRDRNDWQALFEQEKVHVQQLGASIAAVERSIGQIVYALFGLGPAEIALIERALTG